MSPALHFTVGSLPSTEDRAEGFFNFEHELGLLKAALLYADRVKLCSVGASFMASLNDLGNAPFKDKLTMVREFLPMTNPDASPEELEKAYRLIDALGGNRAQRRALNERVRKEGRKVLNEGWTGLGNVVEEQFRTVRGAEGFRAALRSGLVELHPFRRISAVGLIQMGMESSGGLSPAELYSDELYDEYENRIYATVQDGTTYPLFDDTTGNMVSRAVSSGLILPSQGAVARGRHGGLSGDLLQRLPLFERASVAEVLNIREELVDHLDGFREAVAQLADAIGPASWDEEFMEEAERIVQERVAPAVRRIERAVEERRDIRELSWRFGPPMATAGVPPSVGVFVGSGSVLGSLAALAVGLTTGAAQAAARHREQRRALEGNQLYFYYRAGELLRGARR